MMKWILAAGVAVTGLVACGGGSDAVTTPTAPLGNNNTAIVVSGKVLAPDGTTPIANALVYVENSTQATANSKVALAAASAVPLACGAPPNAQWAATCSGIDGVFSFSVNSGSKLVVVKGAFRLERTLPAASAGIITLGAVTLAATGTGAPKMAVVTGAFDRIEDILAKLGFGELEAGQLKRGTEKFDLYDGNNPSATNTVAKLFVDANNDGKADIFGYQIVFFNCGLDELSVLTPSNIATLRQYVESGGRIYASDLAYDLIEQVFPQYVDFLGSDTTAAISPEASGAAEEGTSGITVNATVDPQLLAWLRNQSCIGGSCVNADGTVKIEGFLDGWAVINGAHAGVTNVKTWASGAVTYTGASNVVKPLTVSFGVGTGRVTYTSYHNEAAVGAELEPQQRILQYLVFEL